MKRFTNEESKWLLCYGMPNSQSNIQIGEPGDLYLAISLMFELLEERTYLDREKVERIFWGRILALANCEHINQQKNETAGK
jgi:hypothetical protein